MQTWQMNRLSVQVTQNDEPAYSWQMAANDVQEFPFDAGETIDSVEVAIRDLGDDDVEITAPTATLEDELARVTIDADDLGLVRDHAYELMVTFTAGAHIWSRTLVIEIVA